MSLDFAIGVVHSEWVSARFCFSLARAIANIGPIQTLESQTSVIDKGRNEITRRFLEESSKDWFLYIDADMVFSHVDVLALRAFADETHPIVSGVAVRPLQGAEGECVASRLVGDTYQRVPAGELNQPCEIDAVGAAFLLVAREVLEAFPEGPRRWFAFTDERTEDFEFCYRAQKAGYPLWSVPIFVGHRKGFTLYGDRSPRL